MKAQPNINVLVVDDHPIVRDGICAIIDHQQDLDVVGQAANAAEAIALFDSLDPDVTLVDLGLPDIGGIELISILRAKSQTARFIVLTANAGGSEISRALHAGANAYLFKNAPSEELLTAIRTVSGGGRYLSAAVGRSADAIASHPDLTARELEVLKWIVRGHSNSQIAREMGVVEETIKSHVKNVLTKLRVNSRSKAAALALQLGLVRSADA
ncbi:MAG: response regulator containing a CheY-like receiver domain and an DNA-binding domain [Xanthomonadaceae bacterium]|nr:response regulator containing a CheY-like receiver domain and an DNA-binding domain [Xanthomonadaceae bacterium]